MGLFRKPKPRNVLVKPLSPLAGGAKRKPTQGKGPAVAARRSTGSAPLSNRPAGGPSQQGHRVGPASPTPMPKPTPKPRPSSQNRKGLVLRRTAAPSRPRTRLK